VLIDLYIVDIIWIDMARTVLIKKIRLPAPGDVDEDLDGDLDTADGGPFDAQGAEDADRWQSDAEVRNAAAATMSQPALDAATHVLADLGLTAVRPYRVVAAAGQESFVADAAKVQKALRRDEALLSYFVSGERVLALVLSQRSKGHVVLPASSSELRASLERVQFQLESALLALLLLQPFPGLLRRRPGSLAVLPGLGLLQGNLRQLPLEFCDVGVDPLESDQLVQGFGQGRPPRAGSSRGGAEPLYLPPLAQVTLDRRG